MQIRPLSYKVYPLYSEKGELYAMRFDEYKLVDKLGKPVIKTFHSTVPAGKRMYNEHHHTECELSLFLSGKGTYSVSDKTYDFESGDIFLFGSDEIHCVTDISPSEKFNLLNIHFEPRILWSNPEMSDISLLKLFFGRNKTFQNRIDRSNKQTPQIRNMILSLEDEIKTKKEGYEIAARMLLNFVLLNLLRNYNYVKNENIYINYTDSVRRLEKVIDFIDNNLDKELSLEDLAHMSAMSRTYFSTIFKKFNGISPWEYITIKRVEKAIKLLETTSMTKLDIAAQCGFSSSSNFYKAFRKVTKKTPGDFSANI